MYTAVARAFHCCSELLAAITVGSGADDASMLSRAGCRTGIRRDSGAGYLPVECRRIPWNRQLARYEPAVSGVTIPNLPSSRQVHRFAARRFKKLGPNIPLPGPRDPQKRSTSPKCVQSSLGAAPPSIDLASLTRKMWGQQMWEQTENSLASSRHGAARDTW